MGMFDEQGQQTPEPSPEADDMILSEQTAGFANRTASAVNSEHDLVAAYVLDALTDDERAAFESHLANCRQCQAALPGLRRVAKLLPNALVSPPAEIPDAFPFLLRDVAHETLPGTYLPELPDDDEEEELVTPFGAPQPDTATDIAEPKRPFGPSRTMPELPDYPDDGNNDPDEQPDYAAVAPAARKNRRGQGRIRPAARPAPGEPRVAKKPQPIIEPTPTVIAFALLGVVAIGLFLWALLLLGRIDNLQGDVKDRDNQISSLRQNANATSYTLSPTANGPQGATGTFFFSLPDQRGALTVTGLSAPPSGQTYQIWYIDNEEPNPIAGPTFSVDSSGAAAVPLTLNAATFDAVAISLEPAAGSDLPSTNYLLQGQLGGAAG